MILSRGMFVHLLFVCVVAAPFSIAAPPVTSPKPNIQKTTPVPQKPAQPKQTVTAKQTVAPKQTTAPKQASTPKQTTVNNKPVVLEAWVEVDFFRMIFFPISQWTYERIQKENYDLKAYSYEDKYYVVFPRSFEVLEKISKDPKYKLILNVSDRSLVARALSEQVRAQDPANTTFLNSELETVWSVPVEGRPALIQLGTGTNPFLDYDFFESYKAASSAAADAFRVPYVPATEQDWLVSVFRWNAIENALYPGPGLLDGAMSATKYSEGLNAYVSLTANYDSQKKLASHQFNLTYSQLTTASGEVRGCNKYSSLTDKTIQSLDINDCIKGDATFTFAWKDEARTVCGKYFKEYFYQAAEAAKCDVFIARLNQSGDAFEFISSLSITHQKPGGPKPTYKNNNGPAKVEKNGLMLPRTGYTYYRGVRGSYVDQNRDHFIAMLYEIDNHFIFSQDGNNRANEDAKFNVTNKTQVFADRPESIYFSVFPSVARNYGSFVFIVEDVYRRGLDMNYTRLCLGASADVQGEITMPCYVTPDELVGLMFVDENEAAVRVDENGKPYILLYQGYSCLVRSGNKVFACSDNYSQGEYAVPVTITTQAEAAGVIALCDKGVDCNLPSGFMEKYKVTKKAYIKNEALLTSSGVRNYMKTQEPKIFHPD